MWAITNDAQPAPQLPPAPDPLRGARRRRRAAAAGARRAGRTRCSCRRAAPIRIVGRFDDYADPTTPYMFHCHILRHEDNGMMGQFVVVEPGRSRSAVRSRRHGRRADGSHARGRQPSGGEISGGRRISRHRLPHRRPRSGGGPPAPLRRSGERHARRPRGAASTMTSGRRPRRRPTSRVTTGALSARSSMLAARRSALVLEARRESVGAGVDEARRPARGRHRGRRG